MNTKAKKLFITACITIAAVLLTLIISGSMMRSHICEECEKPVRDNAYLVKDIYGEKHWACKKCYDQEMMAAKILGFDAENLVLVNWNVIKTVIVVMEILVGGGIFAYIYLGKGHPVIQKIDNGVAVAKSKYGDIKKVILTPENEKPGASGTEFSRNNSGYTANPSASPTPSFDNNAERKSEYKPVDNSSKPSNDPHFHTGNDL